MTGRERPAVVKVLTARSTRPPGWRAAASPMGSAAQQAKARAASPNSPVRGEGSRQFPAKRAGPSAGRLRVPPGQVTEIAAVLAQHGLSRRRALRSEARASGEAFPPA